MEIKATYADFYELLGTVAEHEGDLSGAIAYYDRFFRLRLDTDRVAERLDELRRLRPPGVRVLSAYGYSHLGDQA